MIIKPKSKILSGPTFKASSVYFCDVPRSRCNEHGHLGWTQRGSLVKRVAKSLPYKKGYTSWLFSLLGLVRL